MTSAPGPRACLHSGPHLASAPGGGAVACLGALCRFRSIDEELETRTDPQPTSPHPAVPPLPPLPPLSRGQPPSNRTSARRWSTRPVRWVCPACPMRAVRRRPITAPDGLAPRLWLSCLPQRASHAIPNARKPHGCIASLSMRATLPLTSAAVSGARCSPPSYPPDRLLLHVSLCPIKGSPPGHSLSTAANGFLSPSQKGRCPCLQTTDLAAAAVTPSSPSAWCEP